MCGGYESMYWSQERQLKLLKERKKALKERMDKVDEMIETLEAEKMREKVPASA